MSRTTYTMKTKFLIFSRISHYLRGFFFLFFSFSFFPPNVILFPVLWLFLAGVFCYRSSFILKTRYNLFIYLVWLLLPAAANQRSFRWILCNLFMGWPAESHCSSTLILPIHHMNIHVLRFY